MKKVIYYIGFVTLGSVLTLQSCYYDKLNELKISVNNGCDTTLIPTYNNVLIVLNNNNCTNDACHGASGSSGVALNNYANVKKVALNDRLLGAINHNVGYAAMPNDAIQIKQCEIDLIKRWVDNNCLEN